MIFVLPHSDIMSPTLFSTYTSDYACAQEKLWKMANSIKNVSECSEMLYYSLP